ncbi:hypothetical protein BDN71DRAFT_658716 [Pleurotus eryngii]|uniref:Hydrophobin n=1 Tax=Pleurotus eryngii TaxID=5323 RepID=A0A9P6A0V6_PLEER|nr:hypothetical protein BDN71DRAFT_658716 [Pleurotus eryngii]
MKLTATSTVVLAAAFHTMVSATAITVSCGLVSGTLEGPDLALDRTCGMAGPIVGEVGGISFGGALAGLGPSVGIPPPGAPCPLQEPISCAVECNEATSVTICASLIKGTI